MNLEHGPRISPFLWFDQNAEEAFEFYASIFKNSKKSDELRGPDGKILTIGFELDGQTFSALNGGPAHKFNEAISLVVRCDSQDEIDYYWSRLTDGGSEVECGWLKDRFGLFWQIVPGNIASLVRHPKAFQAMLHMKKLNIAELERAAS